MQPRIVTAMAQGGILVEERLVVGGWVPEVELEAAEVRSMPVLGEEVFVGVAELVTVERVVCKIASWT